MSRPSDSEISVKVCSCCHTEKSIENFRLRSGTQKRRGVCISCYNKKASEYGKNNREKVCEYQKRWRRKNRDKWNGYSREFSSSEKGKEYSKKWREKNREKCREAYKKYDSKRRSLAVKKPRGPAKVSLKEDYRLAALSVGGAVGTHKPKKPKSEFAGKGRGSHRKGKTTFDFWVEKHGLEEAERRMCEMKDKMSKSHSHDKNCQYGKAPSHKASGRGLSGWYKGHHFRSMNELTFMIQLDCSGVEWKSAEHLSIPYCYGGEIWTYHPDFIVGTRIIEIKPKRLQKSPDVQAKKRGAEIFCLEKGFSYEMIHVQNNYDLIDKGLANGTIEFSGDCLSKYKARHGSRRK